MKKIFFISLLLLLLLLLLSCKSGVFYGKKISLEEANTLPLNEILSNKGEYNGTITGKIISTCSVKGCWLTLRTKDNDTVMVKFKDYSFFVPKEGMENKDVFMSGVLFYDTISVNSLKHYAYDDGRSKQEIDLIKKPKLSFSFIAEGVYVK